MLEVLSAFTKAARDLTRAEILWQAIWPPLVAFATWGFIAVTVWGHAIAVATDLLPHFEWSWWAWIAHWTAVFLVLAGFGALAYGTALVLVALFSLPRMLAYVAARDYPDLMRHGENVFWGSVGNTLKAGAIFIIGWLATLPLLLIPGAVLILPLCWTAWLNQRTFRFDALVEHATRGELRTLVADGRVGFYGAGVGTAIVAHVPLVNLLAPAYAALVFLHLGLSRLRRLRQSAGVQL